MLIALAAGWLVGIYVAVRVGLPAPVLGTLLAVSLANAIAWRRTRWPAVFVALAALSAGGLRVELDANVPWPRSTSDQLAPFRDRGPVEVEGLVEGWPELDDRLARLRVLVQRARVSEGWQPASGRLLVFLPRWVEYAHGDAVRLVGRLETPPSFPSFAYRDYLARQGITATMRYPRTRLLAPAGGPQPRRWLEAVRQRVADGLAAALPEPEAALAQGIVVGQRAGIAPDLAAAFNRTGTSHLLAISGQNISLVAGAVLLLAVRLAGRRWAAPLALPTIGFYAVLAGMSPSVVRAAIMAGLVALAWQVGRESEPIDGLAIAAAAMAGLQPPVLWDIGFQLSFLATAGLAVGGRAMAGALGSLYARLPFGASDPPWLIAVLLEVLAATLAATIATLPVAAATFHSLSLVAPLANALAVPAFPAIMATTGLTGLVSLLSPALAAMVGWLAWLCLAYLVFVVETLARLPAAAVAIGPIGEGWVWASYALLGLVCLGPSRVALARLAAAAPSLRPLGRSAWLALPPVSGAAALVWAAALSLPDGRSHLHFLEVGDGQAVFVRTSGNHRVLIDGGPSPEALATHLGRLLAFHERHLDLVVLTRWSDAHLAGLQVVPERYSVGLVVEPPRLRAGSALGARRFGELLDRKGIRRVEGAAGQRLELPAGLALDVLATAPDGMVLRFLDGQVGILLAGSADRQTQLALAGRPELASAILQVPRRGERELLPAFIGRTAPEIAVVSAGRGNRSGVPGGEELQLLRSATVYRTDLQGSVEIVTDGVGYVVRTEAP